MEKVISTGRRSKKIRGRRNIERDERGNNGEERTAKKNKKKSTYLLARNILFEFRVSSREISNDSAKYTHRGERFRCSRRIIQAAAS